MKFSTEEKELSAGHKTMSTLQTCDAHALTVVSGITYEVDRVDHHRGLAGHLADGVAVGIGDVPPLALVWEVIWFPVLS